MRQGWSELSDEWFLVAAERDGGLGAIVAVEEARVDEKRPLRLLLEGRPGIGKTTVAQRLLAHVKLPGPPRVGRYGVDLPAFERVALPAMAAPQPVGVVVVVDELGKLELASAAFRDALPERLAAELTAPPPRAVPSDEVRNERS